MAQIVFTDSNLINIISQYLNIFQQYQSLCWLNNICTCVILDEKYLILKQLKCELDNNNLFSEDEDYLINLPNNLLLYALKTNKYQVIQSLFDYVRELKQDNYLNYENILYEILNFPESVSSLMIIFNKNKKFCEIREHMINNIILKGLYDVIKSESLIEKANENIFKTLKYYFYEQKYYDHAYINDKYIYSYLKGAYEFNHIDSIELIEKYLTFNCMINYFVPFKFCWEKFIADPSNPLYCNIFTKESIKYYLTYDILNFDQINHQQFKIMRNFSKLRNKTYSNPIIQQIILYINHYLKKLFRYDYLIKILDFDLDYIIWIYNNMSPKIKFTCDDFINTLKSCNKLDNIFWMHNKIPSSEITINLVIFLVYWTIYSCYPIDCNNKILIMIQNILNNFDKNIDTIVDANIYKKFIDRVITLSFKYNKDIDYQWIKTLLLNKYSKNKMYSYFYKYCHGNNLEMIQWIYNFNLITNKNLRTDIFNTFPNINLELLEFILNVYQSFNININEIDLSLSMALAVRKYKPEIYHILLNYYNSAYQKTPTFNMKLTWLNGETCESQLFALSCFTKVELTEFIKKYYNKKKYFNEVNKFIKEFIEQNII